MRLKRDPVKKAALINYADNEYVIRLQQGDAEAFDAFYEKHHRAVYANIFRLVKETEASQDILQEVFIALWENRLALDVRQSVAGWLFVVSYNKSLAYLKKTLKQSIAKADLGTEVYPGEPEVSLKDRQLQLIEEAIEKLSPQKRKVFELCKLQGKTYEETARELKISNHTVKEYLSLAISNVRDYIKSHPEFIILLVSTFLRLPC